MKVSVCIPVWFSLWKYLKRFLENYETVYLIVNMFQHSTFTAKKTRHAIFIHKRPDGPLFVFHQLISKNFVSFCFGFSFVTALRSHQTNFSIYYALKLWEFRVGDAFPYGKIAIKHKHCSKIKDCGQKRVPKIAKCVWPSALQIRNFPLIIQCAL